MPIGPVRGAHAKKLHAVVPRGSSRDDWAVGGAASDPLHQAVFAVRRYEDASLRYTGIESHEGLTHYGLYDTVVARE